MLAKHAIELDFTSFSPLGPQNNLVQIHWQIVVAKQIVITYTYGFVNVNVKITIYLEAFSKRPHNGLLLFLHKILNIFA